jgi:hypothetical protein
MDNPCHPENTIIVDCQNRSVGYQDKGKGFIEAVFGKDMKGFRFCCAIAIAQDLYERSGRCLNWPGSVDRFLLTLNEHFKLGVEPPSLRTYWHHYRSGKDANVSRITYCINNSPVKKGDQGGLGDFLFQTKPTLHLGDSNVTSSNPAFLPVHLLNETEEYRVTHKFVSSYLGVSLTPREKILDALKAEALRGLKERLHSDNIDEYHPLEVKILQTNTDSQSVKGRRLNPYLLRHPPCHYLICSDVGMGKTTFLRHLQLTVAKEGILLPVFLNADGFKLKEPPIDFDELATFLSKLPFCKGMLGTEAFFQTAIQNGMLLFLIDGLDQFNQEHLSVRGILDRLLNAVGTCKLIATSRPMAILGLEPLFPEAILTLKPFSKIDERAYFGKQYRQARKLIQMDRQLTTVPMLAYLVKTIVDIPLEQPVQTRYDLYRRFIDHVFCEHHPNIHRFSNPALFERVQTNLERLAYLALDQVDPQFQSISLRRIGIDNILPNLDELRLHGLVNLLLERPSTSCHVRFTHQSLQEYFAASWVLRKENATLLQKVLSERRLPKWKEVIRFITDERRDEIINQIYPINKKDNIIHSHLMLAAECSNKTNCNPNTLNRIVSDLYQLWKNNTSNYDILNLFGKIGNSSALNILWEVFYCCMNLENSSISKAGEQALEILSIYESDVIPERKLILQNYLAQNPVDSSMDLYILTVIKYLSDTSNYSEKEIEEFESYLDHPDSKVRETYFCLLSRISDTFDKPRRKRLIKKLLETKNWDHEYGFEVECLSHLENEISDEDIETIGNFLHNANENVRFNAISAMMFFLAHRLKDKHVDRFIISLRDTSERIRVLVEMYMENSLLNIRQEHMKKILEYAEKGETSLRITAIKAACALKGLLSPEDKRRLLNLMEDKDPEICDAFKHEMIFLLENDQQYDFIVNCLDEKDLQRCSSVLFLLPYLKGRIKGLPFENIFNLLKYPIIERDVIDCLTCFSYLFTNSQIEQILNLWDHPEYQVQGSIVKIISSIKNRLSQEQIKLIISRIEKKYPLWENPEIDILCLLIKNLNQKQTEMLFLHGITDNDKIWSLLQGDCIDTFIERILPDKMALLCDKVIQNADDRFSYLYTGNSILRLAPYISEQQIERMTKQFTQSNELPSGILYKILQRRYEEGCFIPDAE